MLWIWIRVSPLSPELRFRGVRRARRIISRTCKQPRRNEGGESDGKVAVICCVWIRWMREDTGLTRKVSDLKWQIRNWTEIMWLQGRSLSARTKATARVLVLTPELTFKFAADLLLSPIPVSFLFFLPFFFLCTKELNGLNEIAWLVSERSAVTGWIQRKDRALPLLYILPCF